MASDDGSELSSALTMKSNPWTKAQGAPSVVSSKPPAHRTRNIRARRPIGAIHSKKRVKATASQQIVLDTQETQLNETQITESLSQSDQDSASNDDFKTSTNFAPEQSQDTSRGATPGIKRPRTSHIHDHCTEKVVDGTLYWKCNRCTKKYAASGDTKSMSDHLRDAHSIDPQASTLAAKRLKEDTAIESAMARQREKMAKDETLKKQEVLEVMASNVDKSTLEYLYLKWIINSNLPFDQVEDHDFRVFLQYVNEIANSLLPTAHSTIRMHVMQLFEEGKQRARAILQAAISEIHITCDLWTSNNSYGLLGIIAHFTAENGQLQCLTLALKELEGAHTGENQAAIIIKTLNDFEIRNRLGYFMMDNAASNDTLVEAVAANLREEGVFYDAVQRRLRCNGHVLNLSAQAFLFGKTSDDLDYLDKELDCTTIPTEAELQKWRKMGPLGKLHNIVVYIGITPQRKQQFKKLSNGLLPHWDQKTRWNSFYDMIDWAIERTKDAIIQYSIQEADLEEDVLKSSEWHNLKCICDFLKPFQRITKATEGRKDTIEKILPSMEYLLNHYEKAFLEFEGNGFMISALDAGYDKLIKYFNKNERNVAYIAAVVLNPTRKWALFGNWKKDDLAAVKEALVSMWYTEYNASRTTFTQTSSEPIEKKTDQKLWEDEMLAASGNDATLKSELEAYIDEGLIGIGTSTALE